MKRTFITALAISLALAGTPALAHVGLTPAQAQAGSTIRAVLAVPHGCDGAATTRISVTMPDGLYVARPMPKPGWSLTTQDGDYAAPYDNHGTMLTRGIRRIEWTGELPDAWYDEFVFAGTLGGDLQPGATLYFPVEQTCGERVEHWTGVPAAEGAAVDDPAPALTVQPADEHAHHH